MNVLFVGATGFVGSHTFPLLQQKFNLTAAALGGGEIAGQPVRDLDIRDWDATAAAVQSGTGEGGPFDAVICCTTADYQRGRRRNEEEWRQYFENCIEVNARGAYHVFEAAWRAGVSRVVFIGSMTAVLGQPRYTFIDAHTPDRCNDLYAATKILSEQIGHYYSLRPTPAGSRMQVLCLRLAQPTAAHEPGTQRWIQSAADCAMAADMRDIASAIACALQTDVPYGVYPIVSHAEKPYVAPDAYAELGYEPAWKYHYTPEGVVTVTAVAEPETQLVSA